MGSGPQFTVRTDSRNGVASVAMKGELDMATFPQLEECLTPFEQNGVSAIILDLRDLTFIDLSGLRALVQARERARTTRHRVILVGADASARRLFGITGTEWLLIDDRDAADVLGRFVGRGSRGSSESLAL